MTPTLGTRLVAADPTRHLVMVDRRRPPSCALLVNPPDARAGGSERHPSPQAVVELREIRFNPPQVAEASCSSVVADKNRSLPKR